jgi:type IV secretion system protein VirB11
MDGGLIAPEVHVVPQRGEASLRHSLGSIQRELDVPGTTEVCCNRPGVLEVQRAGAWRRVAAPDLTQDRIAFISNAAASLTGQDLARNPICYTKLPGGDRLTIVGPPAVAPNRACLVMRRREKKRRDFDGDLLEGGLFDEASAVVSGEPRPGELPPEDRALLDVYLAVNRAAPGLARRRLWQEFWSLAMAARKNAALAGIPGSGKTTVMESLICSKIPHDWRLVTIEDAPELELAHENAVQLYYSEGGLGRHEVTADHMAALVLRMFPRLTLFGELRGSVAYNYLHIVQAGNPGLTTLHAHSVRHVFNVLPMMVRRHPAAAHIEDSTIREWVRDALDVVAHFERRTVAGGEAFRCSQVYFRPANDAAPARAPGLAA